MSYHLSKLSPVIIVRSDISTHELAANVHPVDVLIIKWLIHTVMQTKKLINTYVRFRLVTII